MISDNYIFKHEVGIQSVPPRLDPPDLHRLADRLRRHLFNLGLVIADFGQHHIAQNQHQRGKCQPGEQQPPTQQSHTAPDRAPCQ